MSKADTFKSFASHAKDGRVYILDDGRVYVIRDVYEDGYFKGCQYAKQVAETHSRNVAELKWVDCQEGVMFEDIQPLIDRQRV